MARTTGHGNANWTKEETLLALDLLFQLGGVVPDKKDAKVIALSEYLRCVPLHPPERRKGSFRNPDGVAFKLQNLRAVATGKGLQNVSQVDREVWSAYGNQPSVVKSLAQQIRNDLALLGQLQVDDPDPGDEEEFAEGATATKVHKRRERNRKLRRRLIDECAKSNQLYCRGCDTTGSLVDSDFVEAIFEAHHVHPLAGGPTTTKVGDLALLCANCHRLIHRVMAKEKRWVGVPEFRALLAAQNVGSQKAA